jgi:hypothetical protein
MLRIGVRRLGTVAARGGSAADNSPAPGRRSSHNLGPSGQRPARTHTIAVVHVRSPTPGETVANVLVTGGAGFLGARLARQLLAAGTIGVAGGAPQILSRLTVADRIAPPADLAADDRVSHYEAAGSW